MPRRIEQDPKQPGVYYFREDDSVETQDILARIEAIEKHLVKNAAFKVPEPAAGYKRKKVLSEK